MYSISNNTVYKNGNKSCKIKDPFKIPTAEKEN